MKFYILSILLMLLSCSQKNQEAENEVVDQAEDETFLKEALKSFKYTDYVLDAKAVKSLSSWQKYTELEVLVGDVKNANLTFFKDNKDVLKSFLEDLKTTLPEVVNTPAIQARVKVIETMSYKLEGELMFSQPKQDEIIVTVKGFLEAFSNLNFQINKKFERDSQNIQRP